jgi:hypothetical protein
VALARDTTVLASGGGEATELAVLVNRVDDPVDPRVIADDLVVRVDEDDLVELVRRVLQKREHFGACVSQSVQTSLARRSRRRLKTRIVQRSEREEGARASEREREGEPT